MMDNIIKIKPMYQPLVQMPYCCAACVLQWILHRRGYWVDQEIIAKELKIKIPKKHQKSFSVKLPLCKTAKDAGPTLGPLKDVKIINNIFKKYNICLTAKAYPISKIKNPQKIVIENLNVGNDLIAIFHWKGLKKKKWNWAHRTVVAEFNTKNNIVTLGDPGYDTPKYWKISLNKLIIAMNKKYDGWERGFYIIKSR